MKDSRRKEVEQGGIEMGQGGMEVGQGMMEVSQRVQESGGGSRWVERLEKMEWVCHPAPMTTKSHPDHCLRSKNFQH